MAGNLLIKMHYESDTSAVGGSHSLASSTLPPHHVTSSAASSSPEDLPGNTVNSRHRPTGSKVHRHKIGRAETRPVALHGNRPVDDEDPVQGQGGVGPLLQDDEDLSEVQGSGEPHQSQGQSPDVQQVENKKKNEHVEGSADRQLGDNDIYLEDVAGVSTTLGTRGT